MNSMTDVFTLRARVVVAAVALVLIVVQLVDEVYGARVDMTTFYLLVAAALVLLVPWERLESFRGGSVEITIRPELIAAVENLQLDSRLETKALLKKIESLGDDVEIARGGRVLWVDDNPHHLLGERRILRALGVTVTTAISSACAIEILDADNDFDLLVSDVQRKGESHQYNDGSAYHEGVNFVCRLRDHKDPNIAEMPVIFYASYTREKLIDHTRPARERLPEAVLANTPEALIEEVIRMLGTVRRDPIEYRSMGAQKTPTRFGPPVSGMPPVKGEQCKGAVVPD